MVCRVGSGTAALSVGMLSLECILLAMLGTIIQLESCSFGRHVVFLQCILFAMLRPIRHLASHSFGCHVVSLQCILHATTYCMLALRLLRFMWMCCSVGFGITQFRLPCCCALQCILFAMLGTIRHATTYCVFVLLYLRFMWMCCSVSFGITQFRLPCCVSSVHIVRNVRHHKTFGILQFRFAVVYLQSICVAIL
jgi:hypothetical protein